MKSTAGSYGLFRSTAIGVGYLGVASAAVSVVRVISIAVLSRLLTAEEFGLAAVSLSLVQIGQEVGAFGLETTVIKKGTLSEDYINTCFWVAFVFAIALCILYWVFSILIAWVMKMEDLVWVIRIMSIAIPVTCLGMIPRSLLERDLSYGKVALLESGGQILAQACAIALALSGIGVWALVCGFLGGEIAKSSSFLLTTRWFPKFYKVPLSKFDALQYGSFVTADRILTYLSLNADRLIIGRFLGPSAVGYYTLAYEMVAFPAKRFSSLVGRVLLPLLSHSKSNDSSSNHFVVALHYVALITVPMLSGLMIMSPEVSRLVYGPMAQYISPLLRMLVPAGIVFAILTPTGSLLYSQNRPDLSMKWSFGTLATLCLFVSIGTIGGLYWATALMAVAWVTLFPVMFFIVARITQVPLSAPYRALIGPVVASILVAFAAFAGKVLVGCICEYCFGYQLLGGIVAGAICFCVYIFVAERKLLSALGLKNIVVFRRS